MKKEYVFKKLEDLGLIVGNFKVQVDKIGEVLPTIWECDAMECAWRLVDTYIGCLSELTGMDKESLFWWVYDCDFGNTPSEWVLNDGTKILCGDLDAFIKTLDLTLED